MSMKQTSKKELIVIKSVEPEGWGSVDPCNGGGIPPLGTVNSSGVKTSEDIPGDEATPVRGGFEILIGKTSLSFKTEPDKVDSQDISGIPKEFIRGFDTYTGQLEFEQLKNSQRIQGAVDGFWDPDELKYRPYHNFRVFEIWTVLNPMDENGNCDMTLNAKKCDVLMKHYGVVLDSIDETREVPNKLSVPISRRFYERFKNFAFSDSPQKMLDAKSLTADVPYSLSAEERYPREHTRLWITGTLPPNGTITFYGYNIFGEPVSETLTFKGGTNLVGNVYFTRVDKVVSSVNATITLQDFDYALTNPI